MQKNHDDFLNEVISKVSEQGAKAKTKKSRTAIENSTIEALKESTNLSQKEIKRLMEDVRRKERAKEDGIKQKKRTKAIFVKSLVSVIVILLIITALIVAFNIFKVPVVDKLNEVSVTKIETTNTDEQKKLVEQVHSVEYKNHQLLMNAVKDNKASLVTHLLTVKKIPLYYYAADGTKGGDIFYESTLVNNRMIKTVLNHGADPFYNFDNYQLAVDQAYYDNNDAFFALTFNHLNKVNSTPAAIKQLWGKKIPYTSLAAQNAYNKKDFETLNYFNLANTGKYSHNWFEAILVAIFKNNDIEGAHALYNILITQEKNEIKRERVSQFIQSVITENKNQQIVDIFLKIDNQ